MRFPASERRRWALSLVLLYALYVGVEQLFRVVAIPPDSIALLWLPNAVVVTYLLRAPRRRWWQIMLVSFLASVLGDYTITWGLPYFSHQTVINFGEEAVNLTEQLGVALAAQFIAKGQVRLDRVRGVVAVCVASVAVPAFCGIFGGWVGSWGYDVAYISELRSWWFGDAVGYIVGVPFGLVIWDRAWRGLAASRSRIVRAAVIAAAISVSAGAMVLSINSPTPSSQYVVIAVSLLLALAFGAAGAAAASLILACVTIIPLSRLGGTLRVIESQQFIFVVVAAVLLVAAMTETTFRNRMELEEANKGLAESEGRARAIFSNAPVAMMVATSSERVERLNSAARVTLQIPGTASPERVSRLIPYLSEQQFARWEQLQEISDLAPGASVPLIEGSEVTSRHWDGTEFPAELYVSAGRIGADVRFFIAERDISLRKSMQERIAEQEKLASLGAVTAGIAHELKNPLNFVVNFADVLNEDLEQMGRPHGGRGAREEEDADALLETSRQLASKIGDYGRAASLIVSRMLEQASQQHSSHKLVDVNEVVRSAIGLASSGMSADDAGTLEILTDFDDSLQPVQMSTKDVQRAVTHVIHNGWQAVLDRRARREPSGYQPQVVVGTRDLGDSIEIYVRDNGVGIPDSDAARVFTPFFTTRRPGEGVGLGLSSSHSVVRDHQGSITYESIAGDTTFRITLPRQPHTTDLAGAPSQRHRRLPAGTGAGQDPPGEGAGELTAADRNLAVDEHVGHPDG